MNGCLFVCYIRRNDSSSIHANSGLALNGEFRRKGISKLLVLHIAINQDDI